jgi:undecaprenyl-diphosphatase
LAISAGFAATEVAAQASNTMELLKAIVLGIVQGLTEFLPVSSSGHLVIGGQLLGFQEHGIFFEVCLHLGTLVAVFVVFRRDIAAMIRAPLQYIRGDRQEQVRQHLQWDLYVILATLPAVVVGLFFKENIEGFFTSTLIAYSMLVVTGLMMATARFLPQGDQPVNWWRSLVVGVAQAVAIMPGISRSGATIFAGMALGIDREKVARFSFIMSIPAILGAAVLHLGDVLAHPPGEEALLNIGAGTVAAALSGYLAIRFLLFIIRRNQLEWFGYYCLLLATVGLFHHFAIAG